MRSSWGDEGLHNQAEPRPALSGSCLKVCHGQSQLGLIRRSRQAELDDQSEASGAGRGELTTLAFMTRSPRPTPLASRMQI